jgi:transposase
VLQHHFNWYQLSAIAGLSFMRLYFKLYAGTIKKEQVVEFLRLLLRMIPGKLIVIWDRLPSHRSALVRDFVEAATSRLKIEYLPAYAPELNPVEYVWAYWKRHALANFCADDRFHLRSTARVALGRMRRRPSLVGSFWSQAELL